MWVLCYIFGQSSYQNNARRTTNSKTSNLMIYELMCFILYLLMLFVLYIVRCLSSLTRSCLSLGKFPLAISTLLLSLQEVGRKMLPIPKLLRSMEFPLRSTTLHLTNPRWCCVIMSNKLCLHHGTLLLWQGNFSMAMILSFLRSWQFFAAKFFCLSLISLLYVMYFLGL